MGLKGKRARQLVAAVVGESAGPRDRSRFGANLPASCWPRAMPVRREPISYRTWGDDIDTAAHEQMRAACQVPNAVGAALMPDAHVGYGLPIGGVLACENAVIPYAVGVDIACRMKLSVLDQPVESLDEGIQSLQGSARSAARGLASASSIEPAQSHAVMDRDWNVTRITRERKDTAWKQLGTSGSGNHFVEFGVLSLAAGRQAARPRSRRVRRAAEPQRQPRRRGGRVQHVQPNRAGAVAASATRTSAGWRGSSLDSEAGQEYWAAMNLMGEYAAANHAVIHRLVAKLLGAEIIAGVENHHNFAWKERHSGRELIVHRKGATPAGAGVLGVIPGTMADPAFVVRGLGNPQSFNSASHGAGRRMSRKKANDMFRFQAVRKDLEAARRSRAGGRVGRSAGRLQGHPRGDGRPAGPGRNRRPVRSENRPDVRRRQPGGGLTRQRFLRKNLAANVLILRNAMIECDDFQVRCFGERR